MCGIAGAVGLAGSRADRPPLAPEVLSRMLGHLQHRGPDGAGMYRHGPVVLGHARLSIIDVDGGRQPIANEDRSQWIVVNGEAFNYVELGAGLRARGHRFRSRSDSEVMLHLYEERGTEFVDDLNGQYAFAIWDGPRQRLVLGRDRLGVRPLFYTVVDGVLLFASTVAALLADPRVPRRIDLHGLDDVFTYWSVLPGRTMFAGISEVPAGHLLVAGPGMAEPVLTRYWSPDFATSDETPDADLTAQDAAAQLRDLLTDAAHLRLRADVPVGAYLSGGLDSTAIAALTRSLVADRLQTFSVAFEDAAFDESDHQQRAASWLGTEHHVVHCRRRDIADVFPDVVGHAETPLLRTGPAPLFLLSALVRRQGFKVVLTGEGADEFLGGYDIFKEAMIRRFWAREPESTLRPRLLRRVYDWIPQLSTGPQASLAAFFRQGLTDTDDPTYSHQLRWRSTRRLQRLFSPAVRDALADRDSRPDLDAVLGAHLVDEAPLSQAQHVEIATFLTPYLLSSQGDRMAMAHSVEGRFPFLDHRVVEFARRLPPHLLLAGMNEKALLKRAVADLVPPEILRRPKQPYRAPISAAFLADDAPDYVRDLLDPAAVARTGLFHPPAVDRLVAKCRSGRPVSEHDDMALVGVLSTQLWHAMFSRTSAASPPRADVVDVGQVDLEQADLPLPRSPLRLPRAPRPPAPPASHHRTAPSKEHPMSLTAEAAPAIQRRIHDYIFDNFLFGVGELDDAASLIEEGVLDSTGVLEMVLFVEEQLGIRVSDLEVQPQNFGSVEALTAFVLRRSAVPTPASPAA